MSKYEELRQKAEYYKSRLTYAQSYRDNLENGFIVSTSNARITGSASKGTPFMPFLSNRASTGFGFIETDEFTEDEMDVLKTLVRGHVARLEQKYSEAEAKLQAIEDLLS